MRIICVFFLYHWVSCIMICEIIILCVNPPFLVWKKVRKVKSLSHVQLFVTPWTTACQAPPSMGFARQEHWSGLPFPSPGDLPDRGMDPGSPALQEDPLPSEPPGNPTYQFSSVQFSSVAQSCPTLCNPMYSLSQMSHKKPEKKIYFYVWKTIIYVKQWKNLRVMGTYNLEGRVTREKRPQMLIWGTHITAPTGQEQVRLGWEWEIV